MNSQNSMLSLIARNRRERYAIGVLFTALLIATLAIILPHHSTPLLQATVPAATPAAKVNLAKLPLYFIENQGQSDPQVAYYLQGRDTSVYFTPDGITLALQEPMPATEATAGKPEPLPRLARSEPPTTPSARQRWAVKVQFVGAEPVPPQGRAKTATLVSYFKGPPSDWKTGLSTYTEVAYPDVWPGIEVVYSGDGGHLKTTFHVQPGADPRQIQLAYQGATSVTLTDAGRLAIQTPVGGFEEDQPVVYQEIDGRRMPVEARYTLIQMAEGDWHYGFSLGDYDPSRPLIIDPAILVYCGYIGGGSDDYGLGIAVDGAGQAYVTGMTASKEASFPVRGGPDLTYNGGSYYDAFVAKISADGSQLIYAGYIGGSSSDAGYGIAVDGAGQAYVIGETASTEASFPVRGGPDITYNGGSYDAFVAKVSADGTQLVYAGYIGGSSHDSGYGIAVDGAGQAYVVGDTGSDNFPVRGGPDLAHNGGYRDAFVAKVSADGTQLVYAGYIGGSSNYDHGTCIAVDGLGQAYVVGYTDSTEATFPVRGGPDLTHNGDRDAFVAKISADGTQLVYAGYIGGNSSDSGTGIAVDGLGQAYVAGGTSSTEASFPVRGGPDLTYNGGDSDAFVAKISADGTQLVYAGYIGGNSLDYGDGIAVDGLGQAYLTGGTTSTEATFPARGGPDLTYNGPFNNSFSDAFVAKVSADGTQLVYVGYIGGSGSDYGQGIAVDGLGQVYVTGYAESTEASFPVRGGPDLTNNYGDAFVAKLADTGLVLSMSATPSPVSIGQPLTYTLTVSNNGQIEVPDVVLTDTLPVGAAFSSASSGCRYNGVKTVTCTIGVLTARASTGVTITVVPTAVATLTNTAQVTSATVIDDDLANNQASVITTVLPAPISLNPNSLAFGNQRIGTTSAAQAVTLTNSGAATLTISSIGISGDFAKASTTCRATLAAGAKAASKNNLYKFFI